jgi:hypothetical protein
MTMQPLSVLGALSTSYIVFKLGKNTDSKTVTVTAPVNRKEASLILVVFQCMKESMCRDQVFKT